MNIYIDKKIYGLPKPKRSGYNTRYKTKNKEYLHKVTINNQSYYKVHIKRSDQSKIKYFKNKIQAELFVEMLKINPYL